MAAVATYDYYDNNVFVSSKDNVMTAMLDNFSKSVFLFSLLVTF